MPYDIENAVINQPLEAEGKTQSFEAMPYDVENVAKTQSFDVEKTISEPQVKPAEVRNQFDEVSPATRTTSKNAVYPTNKPDVNLTGTDNISNEPTSREMEDTQNRTNEIAISVPKENPLEIISVAKETPVKMDLKNASDSFMQVELEANRNLDNNYDKKVASLEEKCPETLSIGNQVEDQSKCVLYSRDKDNFHICEDSTLYYNHEIFASLGRCTQKRHPDICSFVNSTRSDARSRLELSCRANACENNTLSIGVMDSQTGKVSYMRARSLRALQQSLMENQMVIKDHSVEFLFLLCQKHHSKRKIHQLLLFPPFVSTQSEQKRRDININVVVIDSVSRPHFYRLLEKTVATMKSINEASSRAQVLDFKYFQSLASFTYVNVQAFFTGKIGENDLKNRQYTFEDLFGPFKQAGYQTLVQEDTCWFDRWGTVLTGNRKVNGIDHNTLWQEVMNVSDYRGVDSFGITHMSCDVFDKSKTASLYNTKKMICLNGRPLSAYFFDYLKAHMRGIETTEGARPLISYTHIDFAHESSGIRLKAVDTDLADFVKFSSEQEDTLTVLWSDHGGKTTRYSIEKLTGRFEIYDPFMFVIVPNKVSKMIGQEKIDGLKANQNSLCTVIDLRNTLLGLLPNAEQQDDDDLTSSKIASREDCHGFPMRQYGFCKCMNNMEVMDLQENSNAEFLTWLADYAVGKINNRISENQPNVTSRCVRISAIKIRNVIKKKTAKQEEVYTFDVVAASPRGVKNREVFSFQVLYNRAREVGRDMLAPAHWQRVSIYNYYQRCKDARVPLEICACRRGQAHTLTLDYITRYKQFGHRGDTTPALDGVACLLQIRRQTGNVVSFELANMCQQVLIVGYSQPKVLYGWEVAESLPKQATIAPYKMTYLTSFLKVAHTKEYVQLIFWKVG